MKLSPWDRLRTLLFFDVAEEDPDADKSRYERLAVPHSFKPRLSVVQAFVAATIAFLRIFSGALLFAFWGTYSLIALARIQNPYWRWAVLPPLLLLFLALLGLLMFLISSLARLLYRRPRKKIA